MKVVGMVITSFLHNNTAQRFETTIKNTRLFIRCLKQHKANEMKNKLEALYIYYTNFQVYFLLDYDS